jgi:hypothetical protein
MFIIQIPYNKGNPVTAIENHKEHEISLLTLIVHIKLHNLNTVAYSKNYVFSMLFTYTLNNMMLIKYQLSCTNGKDKLLFLH